MGLGILWLWMCRNRVPSAVPASCLGGSGTPENFIHGPCSMARRELPLSVTMPIKEAAWIACSRSGPKLGESTDQLRAAQAHITKRHECFPWLDSHHKINLNAVWSTQMAQVAAIRPGR